MKELFQAYLQNSIGLSVVGILILALSPLLSRRYSAKCRYTLWLIVMFALIIPIRPQLQIYMPKVIQSLVPAHAKNLFNAVNENGMPVATGKTWDLWQAGALLWAVGALCFLCWYAFHHFRFRSAVRRWSEEILTDRKEQFQSVKNEMRIKRQIAIRSCACIRTPMMVGLLNPVILFPKINLSSDEFSMILRHELVHYKRKDLYSKMLVMLALTIHWFNPVVHVMVRSALGLCEISCDEEVLHGADSKIRAHYGETIIGVVQKGKFYQTALSTNFCSGAKGMKKRIYAMMDMKKKRFSLLALFIVAILTFCGTSAFAMTNQSELNHGKQVVSASFGPSLQSGDSSAASAVADDSKNDGTTTHNSSTPSTDNSPQLIAEEQKDSVTFRVTSEKSNAVLTFH